MNAPRHGATLVERTSERHFDVWNEVPLVAQLTGMSCWAAAAAMIVGWRERTPVDAEDVATGAGRWAEYREGLHPDDIDALAQKWGLSIEQGGSWSVERMRRLLEDMGPLWLGEASPGLHAIVVTGIHGDGTPDGTRVRVADPWPIGVGERYELSFRELMHNFDAATAIVGTHAQVLHSGGRGRGPSRHIHRERHRSTIITTPEPRQEHTMDTFSPSSHGYGRQWPHTLGAVSPGERYLESSTLRRDALASHGGRGENLLLRWNALPDGLTAIDIVVHLHGYSSHAADRALLEAKVGHSGAELERRSRPTLVLVPRGRKITAEEIRRNPRANRARYTFPGLTRDGGAGLEDLVACALEWLAARVLGREGVAIMVDRLVLTAHSGGGAALEALLADHSRRRVCNPHEVHLFDATYGPHAHTAAWAASRARADRQAGGSALRSDMADSGGALRVLHRGGDTRASAEAIARALATGDLLGGAPWLAPYYRVEQTSVAHNQVARRFGPILLENAAASIAAPARGHAADASLYGTPVGLFAHYRPGAVARSTRHDPDAYAPVRALVDENSSQTDQSREVRLHVARTIGQWEGGGRYDRVHDDSNRVNFGIGSWTGRRIADVMDSYERFATAHGLLAQMRAHFGGQAGFDAIRSRFRAQGAAAALSSTERAQMRALGADRRLQGAQDEHLATDIRADLDAIGSQPPWYPYIDGGMGAISEVAAHVLVHARHQSGGAGFHEVIRRLVAHFGGEAAMGRDMAAGRLPERTVLEQVRDIVVSRVRSHLRAGVRNRYDDLLRRFSGSRLSYYFDPS